MIRGVLFDMDGVLVDNTAAHLRAFMEFAARHSITITSEQFIPLFGRGNEEIFPAIMDRGLIDRYGIDALADEKERIYRETYASEIHPMTGLLTFLDDLAAHGILCAVGSSGPRANVDFVLERCNMAKYFQALVSGDDVTRCKPDPQIYLKAAAALGLAPSACVVIEDSINGIRAAEAAGMPAIAITTTEQRSTLEKLPNVRLIIDDFTSLSAHRIAEL
mgnify:CR=1 FL=1